MLIAISTYTKSLEEVDVHRKPHVDYLQAFISAKKLLAAGRQTPPTGAIIIARNLSLDAFKKILDEDPYCLAGVAEYKILEFNPVLCDEAFRTFIS